MTCPICNAEPCGCVPADQWPAHLRSALVNGERYGINDRARLTLIQKAANEWAAAEARAGK